MRSNQFIFGVICIICSTYIITDAAKFKLTNAVCKSYNSSWVVINNCRLKAVRRDVTVMNLNVSLLHPANNINVHYQVLKKESGYKPWLANGNLDVCRFLKKSFDPTAIVIFKLFKEFSNFNSTCPLLGDQLLKDFYLKPESMPLPLPTGDYMLALRWSFNHKIQFETNVSSSFVEDPFVKIN